MYDTYLCVETFFWTISCTYMYEITYSTGTYSINIFGFRVGLWGVWFQFNLKKAGGLGGGVAEFDEGGLKKDKKVKGWLKSNRNKFLGTVGMSLVSSPNNYLTEFLLLSNQDFWFDFFFFEKVWRFQWDPLGFGPSGTTHLS